MRQKSTYKEFISRPEILFWLPIVTALLMMTVAFGALKSDVALLNQKVDIIIAQQEKILVKYSDLERRYGELSLKVNKIETEYEMNRNNP